MNYKTHGFEFYCFSEKLTVEMVRKMKHRLRLKEILNSP